MQTYILGSIGDQINILVWGKLTTASIETLLNYAPYNTLLAWLSDVSLTSEPMSWYMLTKLVSIFGINSLLFYQGFILLLNFVTSLILFRKSKYKYQFAILNTFTSYFWLHVGEHLVLINTWIFNLITAILLKSSKRASHFVLIAVLLVVGTLISNYIGYVSFLFVSLFILVQGCISTFRRDTVLAKETLFVLLAVIFGVLVLAILLKKPLLLNYVTPHSAGKQEQSILVVKRPIEDFFTFSVRPWYFVMPPLNNPLLGSFTESVDATLKSTNYFLSDDYFAQEHGTLFFGSSLILFVLVMYVYIIRNQIKLVLDGRLIALLASALILFTMALPPYIVIGGVQIYTPGYFVYKMFPMFRVTSRFAPLFLLSLLLLLNQMLNLGTPKIEKLTLRVFSIIVLLTLLETYSQLKITVLGSAPHEFVYLKEKTESNDLFAIYPYSQTQVAFLWLPTHERRILNMRGFETNNVANDHLTKMLNTEDGIANLHKLNTRYLLVKKDVSPKDRAFFLNNENLCLQNSGETFYIFQMCYK